MSVHLTYETFAPRVGDTFHVYLVPPTTLPLTLIETTDFAARLPGAAGDATTAARGERFSIVFRGPRAPLLPQGTYPFAHDAIGSFALFIVPIGADPDGIRYEAVFNRMPTAAPAP